jgi:voltage-dependent calcium channel
MITFFVGILACQLVRGDIPTVDQLGNQYPMSFRTVWNSFLAMYQILSSENWTQILYAATEFQTQHHVAWISATFFIAWFIVGNSNVAFSSRADYLGVVLSLFIAVIVYCLPRII